MANVNFLSGSKASWDALATKDAYTFYLVDDNGHKELYLGNQCLTSQDELEAALTRLDGGENVTNSIRNIVKGYIEGLDSAADIPIASVSNDVVTIKAGLTEVDGIIANNSGTDIVLSKLAVTGAAEDVAYDNTDSGMTATDVQAAIDELAEASAGGVDSKTIYVTDNSSGQDDYAKVYKIWQGANAPDHATDPAALIGTINIPKDKVLQDSSIVDITFSNNKLWDGAEDVTELIVGPSGTPTEADAGKYLKMEMQNVDDPLYVNLQTFVDVYDVASGATEVQLALNDHVFSASIVDVDATKITYIPANPSQSIARESVGAALTRLDGADTVTGSVAKKIKDSIGALDAVADGTKTAIDGNTPRTKTDEDAILVLQGLTEADGKLSAMTVVEAAQIGTGTGRSGSGTEQDPYIYANTVIGAKKYAEDLVADVEAVVDDLDVSEFPLAEKDTSTDVITIHGISEADGKIAVGVNSGNDVSFAAVAATGEAADVSVTDSAGHYTGSDVETVLGEIGTRLTWVSF